MGKDSGKRVDQYRVENFNTSEDFLKYYIG